MEDNFMKYILILLISVFFFSCDEQEKDFNYPDGIEKPNTIIESSGCGNIFVYQFIDSLKAFTVSINAKQLNLTKKCQTFDLSDSKPNILVQLEVAGNSPDSVYFNFCTDVALLNQGVTKKIKATSGQLLVSVSEDNPVDELNYNSYYVTIKIKDLRLLDLENNQEILFDDIVFWNVFVGLLPG
jgi:hypothetical protein